MTFSVSSANSSLADSPFDTGRPRDPRGASLCATGAEISITIKPHTGENLVDAFRRLAAELKEVDAALIHLRIFGSLAAGPAGAEAMRRVFGGIEWPVTWVQGAACGGAPVAGLQATALTGGGVQRIVRSGRVVGSIFQSAGARYCRLGGIGPGMIDCSAPEQTCRTLDRMEELLESAGFSLADVFRTWFFLDDLLSWYGAFNEVRTRAYSRVHFRHGALPASTGVAGKNPAEAALIVDVLAAQSLTPSTRIQGVCSPLQCPAPAYGSSFSRAVEIVSARDRRLLISGTASIANGGETLWKNDTARQVERTMEVVGELLRSRGFAFSDLVRATTYFKHPADAGRLQEWLARRHSQALPVISTVCGICRDDLLFELEADAWKAIAAPSEEVSGFVI